MGTGSRCLVSPIFLFASLPTGGNVMEIRDTPAGMVDVREATISPVRHTTLERSRSASLFVLGPSSKALDPSFPRSGLGGWNVHADTRCGLVLSSSMDHDPL